MLKKVDEVFKWNEEQIKVYTAAFREGDAVKVGNKWHRVNKNKVCPKFFHFLKEICIEDNDFILNYLDSDAKEQYKEVTEDFVSIHSMKRPYKIITPQVCEVQAGDKLVWLGRTQKKGKHSVLTFGKCYDVLESQGKLVYKNDMSTSVLINEEKHRWKFWGVIPKWENVKKRSRNS